MRVLALETANEYCSVSVVDENNELYFQLDTQTKAQTRTVLPMIEQALKQTKTQFDELTAIAFSRGPGSFSGVRINAAVTQALAWAHNIPVIPVSTLQALAQAAYEELNDHQVSAVLDARMNQVYIANFSLSSEAIMQREGEEQLLDYDRASRFQHYIAAGTGAALLDGIQGQATQSIIASAHHIGLLARYYAKRQEWVSADQALPVYLRDNAWKKISEQGKTH